MTVFCCSFHTVSRVRTHRFAANGWTTPPLTPSSPGKCMRPHAGAIRGHVRSLRACQTLRIVLGDSCEQAWHSTEWCNDNGICCVILLVYYIYKTMYRAGSDIYWIDNSKMLPFYLFPYAVDWIMIADCMFRCCPWQRIYSWPCDSSLPYGRMIISIAVSSLGDIPSKTGLSTTWI